MQFMEANRKALIHLSFRALFLSMRVPPNPYSHLYTVPFNLCGMNHCALYLLTHGSWHIILFSIFKHQFL